MDGTPTYPQAASDSKPPTLFPYSSFPYSLIWPPPSDSLKWLPPPITLTSHIISFDSLISPPPSVFFTSPTWVPGCLVSPDHHSPKLLLPLFQKDELKQLEQKTLKCEETDSQGQDLCP